MGQNTMPTGQARPCKVVSCENVVGKRGARGYCPKHYKRFMKYGSPLITSREIPREPWGKCSVQECEKPTRTRTGSLCKMHYHRWYRTGEVGEASERIRKETAGKCAVADCLNLDNEGIYCSMHAARLRRHGDPLKVLSHDEIEYATGPDNANWKERPGYVAAHDRVKRTRGLASEHQCIDCGGAAFHWSYRHECPDEIVRNVGGYDVAYSPHVDQYDPRCVPCHKRFDLDRVNALPFSKYYPLKGAL